MNARFGLLMSDNTFSLFARPSFIEGAARILDFGNTLNEYNRARTPLEADQESFATDALAIRSDFDAAIARLRAEIGVPSNAR